MAVAGTVLQIVAMNFVRHGSRLETGTTLNLLERPKNRDVAWPIHAAPLNPQFRKTLILSKPIKVICPTGSLLKFLSSPF
jgi:hypothetical protein